MVLMDLVMPGVDGLEAIRRLRASRPQARVLVLTSFLDDEKLFPAVRAGAAGYLLKDVEPQELVRAIRSAHEGEALLHPAVAARLMEEFSAEGGRTADESALTAREREVLALVGRGMAEQADRAGARHRREDGEDAREQHPVQARRDRPHPGRALRRSRTA